MNLEAPATPQRNALSGNALTIFRLSLPSVPSTLLFHAMGHHPCLVHQIREPLSTRFVQGVSRGFRGQNYVSPPLYLFGGIVLAVRVSRK